MALAQVECPWADIQGNLERMAGWAERAKAGGADLVVFPELCVSGICKDERLASIAEAIDGPSVTFVRSLARSLGLAIGSGFSERTDGLPFNTYVVVEPDGALAGVYRKNHIPKLEIPFWQGDTSRPVFHALGRSMAVSICWDNRHPELLRPLLAWRRRDRPHAPRLGCGRAGRGRHRDRLRLDGGDRLRGSGAPGTCAGRRTTRCATTSTRRSPASPGEGRFWALFVNQAGSPHPCLDFVGPSFVVDPTGRVVAETRDRGEQIVFAEIDGAARAIAAR